MQRVKVKAYHIGLKYKNGRYIKILNEGTYWQFADEEITAYNLAKIYVAPEDKSHSYKQDEKGNWWVESTGSQSSGILNSLNAANCLIALPIENGGVAPGEEVRVIPINDMEQFA